MSKCQLPSDGVNQSVSGDAACGPRDSGPRDRDSTSRSCAWCAARDVSLFACAVRLLSFVSRKNPAPVSQQQFLVFFPFHVAGVFFVLFCFLLLVFLFCFPVRETVNLQDHILDLTPLAQRIVVIQCACVLSVCSNHLLPCHCQAIRGMSPLPALPVLPSFITHCTYYNFEINRHSSLTSVHES